MNDFQERRRQPRVPVARPISARAHSTLEVRILDLSLSGARVQHHGLLRPGATCALEFPLGLGPLVISARIVRSQVVAAEASPGADRDLRYESGLAFVNPTGEQQAALARILEGLTTGGGVGGTLTVA